MSTLIETTDHGAVRELRLARAPANALNPELCLAIAAAVEAAVADGVGGLVLLGGPKVFSGGLDVPHLLSLDGAAAVREAWDAFFTAARALAGAPVPVAAAIAGHAPAGGCVLALCCDYRVMASGPFRIGLNETQVGLVAPPGIQLLMRRAVGARQSERLLVGGLLLESQDALAVGLVDELAGIDEVPLRARAWVDTLLALPRQPMLQTRAIARADLVQALHADNIQLERFLAGWESPDTQSALRALVARLGSSVVLAMRAGCERCGRALPAHATGAWICSFECTFCSTCAQGVLQGRCSGCGGGLVARPIREGDALRRHPAAS